MLDDYLLPSWANLSNASGVEEIPAPWHIESKDARKASRPFPIGLSSMTLDCDSFLMADGTRSERQERTNVAFLARN